MKNDNSKEWKIRASKIGLLMIEPKDKKEVLSETAKSFLMELYNNYSPFKSCKQTDKGNATEDKIIEMMSIVFKKPLFKNVNNDDTGYRAFYENDFFCGTPDIIDTEVYDAKSSYDINTLHKHMLKGEEELYKYQLLAYMHLTGLQTYGIIFRGLVDTPETKWDAGVLWEDIPFDRRWIAFKVDYCEDTINRMKQQVIRAREYLYEYDKLVRTRMGRVNNFY